jgi:hypothetical protein
MEPWNLEETYALVKVAYGVSQQKLTRESARSVVDRQMFAQYHYREALRLSKSFERRHLKSSMLIDLHGPNNEKTRAAFETYIIKAGAHVTAAVQCIHAIPDILAHAVYFASGRSTETNDLAERKLGLPAVVGSLRSNSVFHTVAPILSSSQSGSHWHHLAALANTSKHRTVIRTALSEDWTGKRENYRELQLSAFSHGEEHFPSVSVRGLLGSEIQRLSGVVITVGHELNACLRKAAI